MYNAHCKKLFDFKLRVSKFIFDLSRIIEVSNLDKNRLAAQSLSVVEIYNIPTYK